MSFKRCYTTTVPALAPAGKQPRTQLSAAAKRFGKGKQLAASDEAGSAGPATGNHLEQLRAPKLDLAHLKPFHPEDLTPGAIGRVLAFPPPTLTAFKAGTLPPLIEKEFAFTPRPSTVVRTVTLTAIDMLDKAKSSSSKESRHVLDGGAGSGKSVLMLQAISYAHATNWIVLYLPSAAPLISSSSPHAYNPSTNLFDQPTLSSQILAKVLQANKHNFKTLRTTKAHGTTPAGKPLEDLAHQGKDERLAVSALKSVFEELELQTQFPVLLAMDDAQSLFHTSSYVDPSYHPVESHALSCPRVLLDYISGNRSFAKGAVLLSPSKISTRQAPAFSSFLSSTTFSSSSPPSKNASIYAQTLKGFKVLPVPAQLERREAVGLLELVNGFRGVRDVVSDQAFLEQYVAADGNAREFVKGLGRSAQL